MKSIKISTASQRCPSRLKTCRCRATAFEKRSYRAAMVYKNKLPPRCRDDFFKNSLLYHFRLRNIFATIGPKGRFSRKAVSEHFGEKCTVDKRNSVV
jgi:hypothetical protein